MRTGQELVDRGARLPSPRVTHRPIPAPCCHSSGHHGFQENQTRGMSRPSCGPPNHSAVMRLLFP